jgi:peptidoglycan/xylan/chitin deacetylase (PgdA/CDA1 family)
VPTRAPIRLLVPLTVALLLGVVVGTYVVAPIVEPATRDAAGPTGSSGRASPAPLTGGALPGTGASPASSSSTGTPTPPPAGTSGAGRASPSPSPSRSAAPTAGPAAEGVVPILYYHRVEPLPSGFAGWNKTSQDTFLLDDLMPFALTAQLDWLKAHGYTTILPRDLVAHWDSGAPLPPRPVILTFDDGFADWRQFILPQLQKRGMVAEFYVVIANVGRSISWDDVRTLAKAGMGIGAHDVQHVQLAGGGVVAASAAVMRYQVTQAKKLLEQGAGVTVDSMAYVGGGFNETLLAIVRQAGYTSARSIERGVKQSAAIRYHLHVSRIGWHDDVTDLYRGRMAPGLPTFAKRVSGESPG